MGIRLTYVVPCVLFSHFGSPPRLPLPPSPLITIFLPSFRLPRLFQEPQTHKLLPLVPILFPFRL
jgi:hypothetical protein